MKPGGIGFDVFGTLVDPLLMGRQLSEMVGPEQAQIVARVWREKQLEYSFRRGLMGAWADFGVCTEQALEFALMLQKLELSDKQKQQLLEGYSSLPPYSDVIPALQKLQAVSATKVAFTNGSCAQVEPILSNAQVLSLLDSVVSVDQLQTFKPAPALYHHLCSCLATEPQQTWLVSSNPFDVIGAKHAGLRAAWVQRNPQTPFDPWGIEPDLVVGDLLELVDCWQEG